MTREYLFRGIREDNGEWVYGDLITKPIHHECVILADGVIHYAVKPETVGQYTERKDKNGKSIYEADIIKVGDKIMPVSFERGSWRTQYSISPYRLNGWNSELIEVIGNIHQNPELLKKD